MLQVIVSFELNSEDITDFGGKTATMDLVMTPMNGKEVLKSVVVYQHNIELREHALSKELNQVILTEKSFPQNGVIKGLEYDIQLLPDVEMMSSSNSSTETPELVQELDKQLIKKNELLSQEVE